ncbi:MAG: PQQ-binding-like beta-propeller repeat protein [bacterium]|nr:PQQ-binding-like beta-propeller repeat protein [bacterium]
MNKKNYTYLYQNINKAFLAVIFLICLSIITLNQSIFADDWHHFGYDDQYTSFNPAENTIGTANVSQLSRKWGTGCDDGYFSVYYRSPAIYNGTLYTSGAGSKLKAYNARTGAFLWEYGNGNYGWAPQPVVSNDGIVFYMEETIPTYLYAVNASTGAEIWKAPLGFDLGFSGAAEALVTVDESNNAVYLVQDDFGDDGKLYAINKTTGAILWYLGKTTDSLEFKDNYVLLKSGKIFARAGVGSQYSAPEHMIRIDPADQEVKTTFDRPSSLTYHDISKYTLCNNRLIVGYYYQYGDTQYLAAYNPTSPTVVWEKEISQITGKIACNTTNDVIYVPTNPYLYALDAATGDEIWKYRGYDAIYNPSAANGVVYIISDTNMYALNENTGARIFTYPLGYDGEETSQVAICDGMLYFSGNGGTCDLFALGLPSPEISTSRTQLYFGADTSGSSSGAQTFSISKTAGSSIDWSISDDQSWLACTPSSGTDSGRVTVSVNAAGLSAGTYNGTVTVTAPGADNSPRTVSVILNVYNTGGSAAPLGQFSTPLDGAAVSSSIAVTGWVLDDVGVNTVSIYREDGGSLAYIGDALFVEGARPDVEQAYPTYPMNYKAGWGYMMLTNFLPNGGNGTFKIHAIATDMEGHQVTLGVKTITVDNLNAVKPFGAIDTPVSGGTASGGTFRNVGWVLTPMPNAIPTDGSTISVIIDGVNLGHPSYDIYREDIANYFPGYANSSGALAYFEFDTANYSNGVHTIAWSATDNAGNSDGIGSRYFIVDNTGNREQWLSGPVWLPGPGISSDVSNIPVDYGTPVNVIKGHRKNVAMPELFPDDNGNITVEIKELEHLELRLVPQPSIGEYWSGYQFVGNQIRPLPIGSFLDSETGIFYWQPGPGFVGEYSLKFMNGEMIRKDIVIRINFFWPVPFFSN